MLGGCQQPERQENIQDEVELPAPARPPVSRPEPLDRSGLLAAIALAASAKATGSDHSVAQRLLDGRQFELRIRFGCGGPSGRLREEWLGWSLDRETHTLRVRAMPTLSADEDLVGELGAGEFEAVEGFWIPRPWLLEAACPATAALSTAPGDPVAEPGGGTSAGATQTAGEPLPQWPRIGIAQFFTGADPRTGRRSMRPYEAVKTIDGDQPIGSQGFDLVLSGRLRALPEKGVILCASKEADSPPECIVSADFDRVWIERPDNREIIAEWGSG